MGLAGIIALTFSLARYILSVSALYSWMRRHGTGLLDIVEQLGPGPFRAALSYPFAPHSAIHD